VVRVWTLFSKTTTRVCRSCQAYPPTPRVATKRMIKRVFFEFGFMSDGSVFVALTGWEVYVAMVLGEFLGRFE
jgi:hypothetical protein